MREEAEMDPGNLRIATEPERDYQEDLPSGLLDWLLEGDPAIRWQVLRDLAGAGPAEVAAERERVAETGWGARLLSCQEPSGMWGGGLYSPKWISTTYTLLQLRDLGLPPSHPQALQGCRLLVEHGLFKDGGINFSPRARYSETCITGMVLSICAYFQLQHDGLEAVAGHLLDQQLPDGGWNCRSFRGDKHSSFHTTISALEGLDHYLRWKQDRGLDGPREQAVREAQGRGYEFLLVHRLFRSHRTGEVADPKLLRFPFPSRWRYDVMRALDTFATTGVRFPGGRDERLRDGIDLIEKKRLPDGRWTVHRGMSGKVHFQMETAGKPSRWNTLRGLRILGWWEALE
jgi:hypothetical protein